MTEQKQKILTEGKETKIRHCVLWIVTIYAAIMTFLFVDAQIKLVDAQSELANAKSAMASVQMIHAAEKASVEEEPVVIAVEEEAVVEVVEEANAEVAEVPAE